MLILIFSNNTAYFSYDSERFRQKQISLHHTTIYKLGNIIHNFAIVACIIQLCIVYFVSGIYQLMGELWQNGTAIYYISQVEAFSRPSLRYIVDHFLWLTIIGSYLSIIVKISFPFTIINKKLKPFVVIAMVTFHFGIAIGMGLLTFSLVMISMELLLFSDKEYRKGSNMIIRILNSINTKIRTKFELLGSTYFKNQKVILFYDGWCPICSNIINNFKKIDLFNLLICKNFRDPNVVTLYKLDTAQLEKRMHSQLINNYDSQVQGIHSIFQIVKRIPLLWFLIPFIKLSISFRLGAYMYDFLASKRKIVPTNHCTDLCILPTKD